MLRLLVFGAIIVLALPLMLVYLAYYMVVVLIVNRRQGISGTTYEPFTGRLLMHEVGERPDEVAKRLARVLPATRFPMWDLAAVPFRLALRLSGHRLKMLAYPPSRPPTLMALMTLRTEFFDQALRDALGRVDQVVILGAGWDTRLYDLPEGTAARLFEVDAPKTSAAKQAALAEAGIDVSRVTFVAADFNRQSWLEALRARGFDPDRPTFVLWEGVCMYLEEQAVAATLRSVESMAEGSAIAFDYLAAELVRGEKPFRVLGPYMTKGISWTYGEHVVFGLPMVGDDRALLADYLGEHGLELARFEKVGTKRSGFYGFAVAKN
jgi:methyltransferase (TIGR00027 family)